LGLEGEPREEVKQVGDSLKIWIEGFIGLRGNEVQLPTVRAMSLIFN